MMAWILRGVLVVEAGTLILFFLLIQSSAGTGPAAVMCVIAVLLLPAMIVAAISGIARAQGGLRLSAGIRPSAGRFLGEWLALLALSHVFMPFERWCMGKEESKPLLHGQVPLLLVHGYVCNRGFWWWWRRRFRAIGVGAATISLEPPFAGIDVLAEKLHERIEALCAHTGADRVALVTHSMGGLVVRAYMRQYGAGRVARAIMLAAPHHGTVVARHGIGTNARQMEPDSAWLGELNGREPLPVPALSIWSGGDGIVVPPESARLDGVREVILPDLGHLALAFSGDAFAIVADEIGAG